MAMKRVIAPDQFNMITGCYFESISQLGHTPGYLRCRYRKNTKHETQRVPVYFPDKFEGVIQTHGKPYIVKVNRVSEASPYIWIHYREDPDLWDEALNKACAVWGKEAIVTDLVTKNRETGQMVHWQRHSTENGRFGTKLILLSIDGVFWRDCTYPRQQKAAGEFWDDTCEFVLRETTYESPRCRVGAHS